MHSFAHENYLWRIFGKSATRPSRALSCTLLPRGRNSILSGRARAYIEQGRAGFCTRSKSGCSGCVQRDARGLTRLCHLHSLLPGKRAARAVVQQIVARCRIGQARNEMIDSERELRLS